MPAYENDSKDLWGALKAIKQPRWFSTAKKQCKKQQNAV